MKQPKRQEVEGLALIDALTTRAEELALNKYELAEEVGLTYTYLRALSTGQRPVKGLSNERIRSMAKFLQVPVVEVMMLAGQVSEEDFFTSDQEALERELNNAYRFLREDPAWGYLAPSPEEWGEISRRQKVLITLLYSQVSGKKLIQAARRTKILPASFTADHELLQQTQPKVAIS